MVVVMVGVCGRVVLLLLLLLLLRLSFEFHHAC